jgi:hypothetical protein
MQWSDLSFAPVPRALRRFAAAWLLLFAALACWQGFRQEHVQMALVLAGVALGIGTLGLMQPRLLRPLYVAVLIAAFPVGWTMSRVLLAGVFYGLFMPLGFLFRLLGRDVLCRRLRPERSTYWTAKPAAADAGSYFRQF